MLQNVLNNLRDRDMIGRFGGGNLFIIAQYTTEQTKCRALSNGATKFPQKSSSFYQVPVLASAAKQCR